MPNNINSSLRILYDVALHIYAPRTLDQSDGELTYSGYSRRRSSFSLTMRGIESSSVIEFPIFNGSGSVLVTHISVGSECEIIYCVPLTSPLFLYKNIIPRFDIGNVSITFAYSPVENQLTRDPYEIEIPAWTKKIITNVTCGLEVGDLSD